MKNINIGILVRNCIIPIVLCVSQFGYSQQNKLDRPRPISIDNVAAIDGDTLFLPDSVREMIFTYFEESLGDSLMPLYHFRGSVIVLNRTGTQYLRFNSNSTAGYWSNYFTVGYWSNNSRKKAVSTQLHKFISDSTITLGISEKKLLQFMGKKPSLTIFRNNKKLIKFYWFSKNSIDYLYYGIPYYVSSFIFKDGKLQKFGFGRYKGEIDNDFYIQRKWPHPIN